MAQKIKSLYFFLVMSLSGSIILIAAFLIYTGQKAVESAVFASTNINVSYMVKIIEQRVGEAWRTGDTSLSILENSRIAQAHSLAQKMEALPLLANVLNGNEMADAVYLGAQNGDFFYLRKQSPSLIRILKNFPPQTAFFLIAFHQDKNGKWQENAWFLDDDLKIIPWKNPVIPRFSPQERIWFLRAQENKGVIATRPYVFQTTGDLGITLAKKIDHGKTVIAIDILTKNIRDTLISLRATPNTEIAISDIFDELAAYTNTHEIKQDELGADGSVRVKSLHMAVFNRLIKDTPVDTTISVNDAFGDWYGYTTWTAGYYGNPLRIMVAIPRDELLFRTNQKLREQTILSSLIFIAFILASLVLVGWIFEPLRRVSQHLLKISQFDFAARIDLDKSFTEMSELGASLNRMSRSLHSFQELIRVLNQPGDEAKTFEDLLHLILRILEKKEGQLYLRTGNNLKLVAWRGKEPLQNSVALQNKHAIDQNVAEILGIHSGQFIGTPLKNREGALLGLLCVEASSDNLIALQEYANNIAQAAAVGIETRQLIAAQKALQDGIMQLIASGIDAKSHHTGGHCKRVPQLSIMIFNAACDKNEGVFKDFSLTEKEKEEFRIAAWLHDCGKLTTPEYVVDKATKLETIYNRIHEIRTRFEVLHRDAQIRYLEAVQKGENKDIAQKRCLDEQHQLQDDFAFIARANIGGEFMHEEDILRVNKISQTVWLRHFDNRQGLARDEFLRYTDEAPQLPVKEFLLADKASHIIAWHENRPAVSKGDLGNHLGFDMKVPQHLYNYGEIYNLSITRGTLTEEERFKINDHIIQTLIMLSSLPWTEDLERVPEIASNHHEALNGNGYPRKLAAKDISLPARIIAIADVFEALTAPDRPYKDGKKLSEALTILSNMVRDNHLDKDIFTLFLTSGIYQTYAEKFVAPEQMDEIDIDFYLQKADIKNTMQNKNLS